MQFVFTSIANGNINQLFENKKRYFFISTPILLLIEATHPICQ